MFPISSGLSWPGNVGVGKVLVSWHHDRVARQKDSHFAKNYSKGKSGYDLDLRVLAFETYILGIS